MRTALCMAVLFSVAACSSAPPPPKKERKMMMINGVRQVPIKESDLENALGARRGDFIQCFQSERMNNPKPASYLIDITVPNDGKNVVAKVVQETPKGQDILRECVIQIIQRVKFPPHVGEVFKVRLPLHPVDR